MEEQRRKQYEDEMRRLEREAEERDRQKRLQEHEEVQKKVARERLDQLRSTELGEKAFTGITEEVSHLAQPMIVTPVWYCLSIIIVICPWLLL